MRRLPKYETGNIKGRRYGMCIMSESDRESGSRVDGVESAIVNFAVEILKVEFDEAKTAWNKSNRQ
jgi:hypothetical protein